MRVVCALNVTSIAASMLVSGLFSLAPLNAAPVRTEKAACDRVKTRIAAIRHFPVSAVAFCDTIGAADSPKGFYILALHSNRHCEGICSTNMGWFAVHKRTGRVFEWDTAEMRLGRRIGPHS
jgi:hypothetical protein